MKKIILLIPLLMLFACTTDPIELNATQSRQGMVSFATLSDSSDVIDASASVVYTRLAQYRFNAASLLRQKRITLDQAKLALKTSDDIRGYLDKGVETRNLLKIQTAGNKITQVAKQLEKGI